jgi:hypothetical protein
MARKKREERAEAPYNTTGAIHSPVGVSLAAPHWFEVHRGMKRE